MRTHTFKLKTTDVVHIVCKLYLIYQMRGITEESLKNNHVILEKYFASANKHG